LKVKNASKAIERGFLPWDSEKVIETMVELR
jgi:hypothetical protein